MTAEKWLSGMDSPELPTERIREVSMKSALDLVVPSPHSRENIRLLRVTRPIIIGFITNWMICQEYALAPDSAPRLGVWLSKRIENIQDNDGGFHSQFSKIGDERQRYDLLGLKSKAIWAIFWVATEKDPEPGVIRPTGEEQRTLSLVQGLDITAIFTQRRWSYVESWPPNTSMRSPIAYAPCRTVRT